MQCCLCGNQDAPHIEHRFTGRDETKLRPWAFCERCFQELRQEREDHDPWIAARYVIFLEYMAGHYDRRFKGNQAEEAVESDNPPTVTAPAERGKKVKYIPPADHPWRKMFPVR